MLKTHELLAASAEMLEPYQVALALFHFGSRATNVQLVTGIPKRELHSLRKRHGLCRPSGRKPESADQVLRRHVMKGLQGSFAVARFEQYRTVGGLSAGWALCHAYADYARRFHVTTPVERGDVSVFAIAERLDMNIDHIFALVGQAYGLWGYVRSLRLYSCPRCGGSTLSDYIEAEKVTVIPDKCFYCETAKRYALDTRVSRFMDMITRPASLPTHVSVLLTALHRAGISQAVQPSDSAQARAQVA